MTEGLKGKGLMVMMTIIVDTNDETHCGELCPQKEFYFSLRCRLWAKRLTLEGLAGKLGPKRCSECLLATKVEAGRDNDKAGGLGEKGVRARAPKTKGPRSR